MLNVAQDPSAVLDHWNANVPDGTSVVIDLGGRKARTRTRGKAFLLNGRPMITLQNIVGAVDLARVTVTPWRRWVKLNREGQVAHWVECDFESEDAMYLELNERMRADRRIKSFELSSVRPIGA